MSPVGDVGLGRHLQTPGQAADGDGHGAPHIDVGHLLAPIQGIEDDCPLGGGDPERHALARAAAIEPEHQAGARLGPPVDERIDAKGAVIPPEQRRTGLEIGESRVPHQ